MSIVAGVDVPIEGAGDERGTPVGNRMVGSAINGILRLLQQGVPAAVHDKDEAGVWSANLSVWEVVA